MKKLSLYLPIKLRRGLNICLACLALCGNKAYSSVTDNSQNNRSHPSINILERQSYKIYVDKDGVMRRDDTGEEVSYYGTNYTLPFAHAYRAINNKALDHKAAIDKDVYHLKRLGFNGFRLHLWDVEIADSAGNLLSNDHLDLLDYLISQLEKEGIDIVLTAQTNFGNGYPEKNIDTGGYSYDYDKCEIHKNKTAQNIQANYLTQLAAHKNPYTGLSYGDDNAIIAIEINNEPCHTAPKKDVTAYINKMVKALKKGGFNKPILYNVSHNPEVTEAYYDADIQGTTYQWYPTGLVAGHQRKGNFLPYVDQYPIPWKDSIKNYNKMARVVYEFDPADVLYSHLYPAVARTFRKEGFQWITQFAYDPIDIAQYNTEYQTHFLNLAYTPAKALSMMIAGEAARNLPRGKDFGTFPTDTVFGDFTLSYKNDYSVYNSGDKFYYSRSNAIKPKNPASLKNIAGTGSSAVVKYDGTGAYFLDEIQPGIWRLELMPDVVLTQDPFEKPSLNKENAKIFYSERPFQILLPQLGNNYSFIAVNDNNDRKGTASDGTFNAYPGVYFLAQNPELLSIDNVAELIRGTNYSTFVAPESSGSNNVVKHQPINYIDNSKDLIITAEVIGETQPEEVLIYPQYVSFWNDHNNLIKMERENGNIYKAVVPKDQLGWGNEFSYNIVVKESGKDYTWPMNTEGTPLDWDFLPGEYYTSEKINSETPIILLKPEKNDKNLDYAKIPEGWDFHFRTNLSAPIGKDNYSITSTPQNDGDIMVRRYVGDELYGAPFIADKKYVVVKGSPSAGLNNAKIRFTGSNGATYSASLKNEYVNQPAVKLDGVNQGVEFRIPLSDFQPAPGYIIPAVYPSFLPREVWVEGLPFIIEETEFVELAIPSEKGKEISVAIEGVWLE